MKIGIIGAVPEEVEIILTIMENVSTREHGNRIYYSGKIGGRDVVLIFSGWGKVAAATTVTSLITEFSVDQIIFIGVAGGIAAQVTIGDIVIAEKLYQHDMDARPLFKQHEIPLTGRTFFPSDPELFEKAKTAAVTLLKNCHEHFEETTLTSFNIRAAKCVAGIIASGDQFVADSEKAEQIATAMPSVLAVEMEGAAVAQVCNDYKIPFVVIRIISDKANNDAVIDFKGFLAEVTKYYTVQLIRGMLTSL